MYLYCLTSDRGFFVFAVAVAKFKLSCNGVATSLHVVLALQVVLEMCFVLVLCLVLALPVVFVLRVVLACSGVCVACCASLFSSRPIPQRVPVT